MNHSRASITASWRRPLLQLIVLNGLCDLAAWLFVPSLSLHFASSDLPAAAIGLGVGLPWLALVASLPAVMRLVTHLGPLCLLRAGLAVQILALASLGREPGAGDLVIAATLFGIGMAPAWVLPDLWLVRLAPPQVRGRWLGIYEAVNGAAIGGGPLLLAAVVTLDVSSVQIGVVLLGAALAMTLRLPVPQGLGRRRTRSVELLTVVHTEPALVVCALLAGLVEGGAIGMIPAFAEAADLDPATAVWLLAAVGLGSIVVQYPVGELCDRIGAIQTRDVCVAVLAIALGVSAMPWTNVAYLSALCFVWGGLAGALYTCALADAGERLDADTLMLAVIVMMVGYVVGCGLGPALGGIGLDIHARSGLFIALCLPVVVAALLPRWPVLGPSVRRSLGDP